MKASLYKSGSKLTKSLVRVYKRPRPDMSFEPRLDTTEKTSTLQAEMNSTLYADVSSIGTKLFEDDLPSAGIASTKTLVPRQKVKPDINLGTNHHELPQPFEYSNHPINKCLNFSNDLINIATRLSTSNNDFVQLSTRDQKLLKLVNIQVPKLYDRSNFLTSKKFADYLKDKALVIATQGIQIASNLVSLNTNSQDAHLYLTNFGFIPS